MGTGASLLGYIETIGNITSNRHLYDIVPRVIRNSGGIPTFGEVLFSNVDLVITIISLFVVLRVIIPQSMKLNNLSFWFLITSFLILPTVLSIIVLSIRQASPNDRNEFLLTIPSLLVSIVPFAYLLFIAWPFTAIVGLEVGILYVLAWLFVFVPIMMGLVMFSKAIAPVLILMLGPGIVPHLANQSFFEFCS